MIGFSKIGGFVRASLRDLLLWGLVALALVAVIYTLNSSNGVVELKWLSHHLVVRAGDALVVVALAVAVAGLLASLWSWLKTIPLKQKWLRERNLLRIATDALAADAVGDTQGLTQALGRAKAVNKRGNLALLLEACVGDKGSLATGSLEYAGVNSGVNSGDTNERTKWLRLLAEPSLAPIAQRRLASIALEQGNLLAAEDYAKDAMASAKTSKATKWAATITTATNALKGNWHQAQLEAAKARNHTLEAKIALQRCLNTQGDEAIGFAKQALRLDPTLWVASLKLFELTKQDAILVKAYRIAPHPAILMAASDELKARLARIHPRHRLSQAVKALVAITQEQDIPKAERILENVGGENQAGGLARQFPEPMARLYRHRGNTAKAEQLTEQAATFRCHKCLYATRQWQLICGSCGGFDCLGWR